MLSLKLDQLFTPQTLEAFRSNWGQTPQEADRVALRIASVFEEQIGSKGASDSRRRRERWLATAIGALVGPEPDFDAWVEALSKGSFDVRPGVTYARSPKSGSPSRFIRRQRERIDKLLNADLSDGERSVLYQLHLDAMRQILVGHIILEMKRAVCAQSAAGLAWPLTLACRDHLADEVKSTLWHFGGNDDLRKSMAAAVEAAIQTWLAENGKNDRQRFTKGNYASGLKPMGFNYHQTLSALDHGSKPLERYRKALWKAMQLDSQPPNVSGFPAPEILAEADAGHVRLETERAVPRYRFFTEANDSEDVFQYSPEDIQRLRSILPALAGPINEPVIEFAAERAIRRAELRKIAPLSQPDGALQEEIADWVNGENPPPRQLRLEHAAYLEEEVCRKFPPGAGVWSNPWSLLRFGHPFAIPT